MNLVETLIRDLEELDSIFLSIPSFSSTKINEEEYINRKEYQKILFKTINDTIALNKAINLNSLSYNEETFYKLLKRIINLNTEFHNTKNTEYEKELQSKLMSNLAELNKAIQKWNSKNKNKILTFEQAKKRFEKEMSDGFRYIEEDLRENYDRS